MSRQQRKRLTPGEKLTMAALWAAGPQATIGGLLELLSSRGETVTYPSVQLHLRACVEKGWAGKRKEGRNTYFSPTIDERAGVAELFEEFAGQYLEGRPAANTEAVAERLSIVTFAQENGSPKRRKKRAVKAPPDLRDRVSQHERKLSAHERSITHLEVELQGLRARIAESGDAPTGKRPRKRGSRTV